MYFSTFVLIMIVTVGVIAFGASIVAKLLNAALMAVYRSLRKTRPVRVVSPLVTASGSLSGEWLRATSGRNQPGVFDAIECAPLEGELVSELAAIASNRKFLSAKV
ncbi:hypothetical protein FXE58_04530 [Vibrio cholerae]|uniref:hypothetical protein n=1 Tax=Vibrio cholerae TaxID=666 RepID=UPI0011D7F73B|nr:hypothetical protein [Vibrio cholerae]EGR2501193.1 hypothetical protein [Vibrio cholerae]TXZ45260.1 hypothetical protein FXE58_04530 [Vibrio cholerae]GIC15318.1 hypothetical protein VCSRO52_2603 [Vibrio cholerae]